MHAMIPNGVFADALRKQISVVSDAIAENLSLHTTRSDGLLPSDNLGNRGFERYGLITRVIGPLSLTFTSM